MARRAFGMVAGTALAGAGVLLLAGPARAAGMPQLDFANPLTLAQIVWLALIFLALYLLLSRWALPEMGAVLAHRAERIAGDLDAARLAKEKADAAVAELTQATREAHAGAQSEIAQAIATAKAAAEAQAGELNAKLDAQIAGAEERIGQARAAALGALEQVAVDTAQVVVARADRGADGQRAGAASGRRRARRARGVGGSDARGKFLRRSAQLGGRRLRPVLRHLRGETVEVLTGMLDKRTETVRAELAEASRLRTEAEAMLADASARREAALAEAKAMLERAPCRGRAASQGGGRRRRGGCAPAREDGA